VFTDSEFSTKWTKSSLKDSKIPWERQLERYLLPVNSLSVNTWNVYANAEKSFEKIRKKYDLEKVWPVPILHLINFVVYLAKNSYSPNTAKSYIVAIGFKTKIPWERQLERYLLPVPIL
jgi:hypothetical protein